MELLRADAVGVAADRSGANEPVAARRYKSMYCSLGAIAVLFVAGTTLFVAGTTLVLFVAPRIGIFSRDKEAKGVLPQQATALEPLHQQLMAIRAGRIWSSRCGGDRSLCA